jgi:hypothetical protein
MTNLERALREITNFLVGEGVPHMLIGGLAVSAWSPPRTTLADDLAREDIVEFYLECWKNAGR